MYCKNCGYLINENDKICPNCFAELQEKDDLFWIFVFFGISMPLIGLILYFIFRRSKPYAAKGALWGSLPSLVISGIILIFLFITLALPLSPFATGAW